MSDVRKHFWTLVARDQRAGRYQAVASLDEEVEEPASDLCGIHVQGPRGASTRSFTDAEPGLGALSCLVPRLDELSSQLRLALGHGRSPFLDGLAEALSPLLDEVEGAPARRLRGEPLGGPAGPA